MAKTIIAINTFMTQRTVVWGMMIAMAFGLLSCSKDININDDYKNITIVYGLLDQQDSLSYIRIEKAFLSNGSIYQDAQHADSNQYANKLEVILSDANGMQIVFDTTTVYHKNDGIFYKDKMKVYVADTKGKLQDGATYKLKVRNPITGDEQTAQCKMIDVSDFTYSGYYPGPRVNFTADNKLKFKTIEGVGMYQLMIRFNYIDSLVTDHSLSYHHVDMLFPLVFSANGHAGSVQVIGVNGDAWFNLIQSQIPVKPEVFRFHSTVEYFLYMGNMDYKTYVEINQNTNSLVIDRPEFTNIDNGYGLFASRGRYYTTHLLSSKTLEKLQAIHELNFIRRNRCQQ